MMERSDNAHVWALILAGGEGTRLQEMTTSRGGVIVPKQFCAFADPHSMLWHAIERAKRIVPLERIVAVVAAEHRRWWVEELSELHHENIIVQPSNRGTAAGVLLPSMKIFERDRRCRIVVLPSDHYVRDEGLLAGSLRKAVKLAAPESNHLVLLGMTPSEAEEGYGWIIPRGESRQAQGADAKPSLWDVERFVEKPSSKVAGGLMERGGLWSTFMFAVAGSTLLRLYARALPEVLRAFLLRSSNLVSLYETLPVSDFSRDLLERTIEHQWVLKVPSCGWSDLGTPKRLMAAYENLVDVARNAPLTLPFGLSRGGAGLPIAENDY